MAVSAQPIFRTHRGALYLSGPVASRSCTVKPRVFNSCRKRGETCPESATSTLLFLPDWVASFCTSVQLRRARFCIHLFVKPPLAVQLH